MSVPIAVDPCSGLTNNCQHGCTNDNGNAVRYDDDGDDDVDDDDDDDGDDDANNPNAR